jgi:hypothetical protein
MKKFTASLATQFMRRLRHFVSIGSALMVAVALLVLAPLFTPAAALAADTSGNWNLDDGSGHRLGAVLFERSDGDFQERCHSLAALQATWINGSA